MLNNMTEQLILREKELIEAGTEYADACGRLQDTEEKYKMIRAEAMNSAVVQGLPNQAQREAKLDLVLQEDERFRDIYIDYLSSKLEQKKAWIVYDVRKELNDNARAMLNNLTFGNKSND